MLNKKIYPLIWDRDPIEDDTLGYCLEYFDVLLEFMGKASRKNLGMVITVD